MRVSWPPVYRHRLSDLVSQLDRLTQAPLLGVTCFGSSEDWPIDGDLVEGVEDFVDQAIVLEFPAQQLWIAWGSIAPDEGLFLSTKTQVVPELWTRLRASNPGWNSALALSISAITIHWMASTDDATPLSVVLEFDGRAEIAIGLAIRMDGHLSYSPTDLAVLFWPFDLGSHGLIQHEAGSTRIKLGTYDQPAGWEAE